MFVLDDVATLVAVLMSLASERALEQYPFELIGNEVMASMKGKTFDEVASSAIKGVKAFEAGVLFD